MRTNFYFIVLSAFLITACTDENEISETKDTLNHSFTLTDNNVCQYEVDGETLTSGLRVLNSLNNNLYVSVDIFSGGSIILPKKTGNFTSGHDFGPANGTEGNNAFLNVMLTYKSERYYAYSSHAYGYLTDKFVSGSECKIKIEKFEGDYRQVEIWGLSGYSIYTLFIGEIHVLFGGTFKTVDGSKTIEVEKGQMRILNEADGTSIRIVE